MMKDSFMCEAVKAVREGRAKEFFDSLSEKLAQPGDSPWMTRDRAARTIRSNAMLYETNSPEMKAMRVLMRWR